MPITTIGIGAAVTPTVIKTYVSHYTNRKPRRQKPTAHISYDEGLNLVRSFLEYASHHTVEDLQSFTAQWVPSPSWVRTENVAIPPVHITKAADVIVTQLGERGVEEVGGRQWWQWRRKTAELKGEWIEMRADYNARKQLGHKSSRIMLYVHGGAYFFGSVDEHRYQMQRHARKLKARVFAPRYRLSPQFPFPCGLQDCLAAYLYLLSMHDPTEIVLAGDSAGGGMVVSILCILRDQGIPLPAGAILISPWVDLTHSFPSVAGDNEFDYIPAHGFMHKPSTSWPPPNDDDMEAIKNGAGKGLVKHKLEKSEVQRMKVQGFTEHDGTGRPSTEAEHGDPGIDTGLTATTKHTENSTPGPSKFLSIRVDGRMVEIRDQIQMYATNQLISHPLVSPVLQPSLGGLCPLLILTGGGEVLRDEQIYLAHKAANPSKYPLGPEYQSRYDPENKILGKYKPTPVQLQVWEDLCHVAPTLSFTRPAKFMYRSIAQFGAWALARAQDISIDVEDEDISDISDSDSDVEQHRDSLDREKAASAKRNKVAGQVGKAGDPLPPFLNHMIRQRVDRYGRAYPLESASSLPALQLNASEIGVIKVGPVKKWMDAKSFWDDKYAKTKRRVQQRRIRYLTKNGPTTFGDGERPPPSALAGRQHEESDMIHKKLRKSFGLSMWSGWGSKHDEDTIKRETIDDTNEADDGLNGDDTTIPELKSRSMSRSRAMSGSRKPIASSRSRSARRTTLVRDEGQVEEAQASVASKPGVVLSGPVINDTQMAPAAATTQENANDQYLTPMFLPKFKKDSYLQDNARDLPDSGSTRTGVSAFEDNNNDNASTMAVFAAPGVSRKQTQNPTLHDTTSLTSPLSQTTNAQDIKTLFPDDTSTSRPNTSSGSALGGYDTPRSGYSVERLMSHQVDINSAEQDGELASFVPINTTNNLHSNHNRDIGNGTHSDRLMVYSANSNGLRSLSSTAIAHADGVVEPVQTPETKDKHGGDTGSDNTVPIPMVTTTTNTAATTTSDSASSSGQISGSNLISDATKLGPGVVPTHITNTDATTSTSAPMTVDAPIIDTATAKETGSPTMTTTTTKVVNRNSDRPTMYERSGTVYQTALEKL